MTLSRRMLLGGAGAAMTAATAPAAACSLVARLKPVGFSDRACRASLRALVGLINAAPHLSNAEVATRADGLGILFDDNVSTALLGEPASLPVENGAVIRGWTIAEGHPDRSPLALHEINLLKADRGIALYQFTLRRDQYHAGLSDADAADDSCGATAFDAFYGYERTSYLGTFRNNALREISAFDVWLRTL